MKTKVSVATGTVEAQINCLESLLTEKIRHKEISAENMKWLEDNGYLEDGNVVLC